MQQAAHAAVSHPLSLNVKLMQSSSAESLPSIQSTDAASLRHARTSSNGSSRIDPTKYKTKLCRHFVRGLPCPFRERCIFAHEEEVMKMAMKDSASTPASPLDSKARSYTPETASLTGEDGNSAESSSTDVRLRSTSEPLPPPPAYEKAPADVPPPSYPRRFRFNPYSTQGIEYERD